MKVQTCKKEKKEKFTLSSDHNRRLIRQQPTVDEGPYLQAFMSQTMSMSAIHTHFQHDDYNDYVSTACRQMPTQAEVCIDHATCL